jgi:nitroreductase
MDERLRIIFARRSVRQFTGEPVGPADVRALLEAGMAAPSARNLRPWHFVAVTERRRLDELAAIHPYGKMLGQAGAAIIVGGDRDESPDYWLHDTAAATENILIAAPMLGLGAVWLGMWPRAEREEPVRRLLGIPERIAMASLIAVGAPAERPEPRTQFDPQRVHPDRW